MASYCEEQYIHSLENKVKEQEAMIDWLAGQLSRVFHGYITTEYTVVSAENMTEDDWIRMAKRAVKK